MKPTKYARTAALCTSIALLLSSCANADNVTRTKTERTQKIYFSWWGSQLRRSYTLEMVDEFEKIDNDISVMTYSSDFSGYKENLDALMNCGKNADVMQINYSWIDEYSPDGEGFYDLYQLSDKIALSNFSEKELAYGERGGKLNAIPISLNAVTFYYNKTLFEQYGLKIPTTWEEAIECAEVLKEDGIYLYETADVYLWLMLAAHEEQISGKPVFGANGFERENFRSMMEFAKTLSDCGAINYGGEYKRENFFEEKSAAQALWISDAEYYAAPIEEYGGRLAVGDHLTEPEALRDGWYVKPTSLYAISANTKNPEAAAELLNYLLNDEHAARLQGVEKGVPLSDSALETLSAKNMLNGPAYEASRKLGDPPAFSLMPTELENADIYNSFFEQCDQFIFGQKTSEQAAADLMEIISQ